MAELQQRLKGDVESLPPGVQSWMMGASAQLALHQLWSAWKAAQHAGLGNLTLTEEDITALVPENLRGS